MMILSSKNKFEICNDDIHIWGEEWDKLGFTTYRQDYYDELTGVTWTNNNGYLKNSKFGLLHRYIMKKWYGEEILQEMTNRGWIVDHMNNDGFDCRITNLEFLTSRHNVAKGQTFDVEANQMRNHIAINMFKDFTTNLYQISIGCNDPVYFIDEANKRMCPVNEIFLLYDCDYRLVINDAEQILLDYDLNKKIDIKKLKCIDFKYEIPPNINFTEQEIEEIKNSNRCFVERNGEIYMILGKGVKIHSAHYKKGWTPSENK